MPMTVWEARTRRPQGAMGGLPAATAIGRYESGARAMSLGLFVRTAELLEVPLDALVGAEEGKAVLLQGKEPQVVEQWRRLSKEQRRAVIAMMRAMGG